jgi:serine/threonine protein kinase
MALAPETILQARYRIVRQLGQGGMGTVYEALDARLNAPVALKETFFSDERLRKQFEREAQLLARLHHPALPRVSDHFNEGDGQFLVMQFIAGDDLWEMLHKQGSAFPPDKVLIWADQLLDALDYLHTQDPPIIHRDIKPQNLKLTGRNQVILLDFGLAKGFAGQISRVTTSGSIFGYTPNYAPLEQIQGTGTTARSDLYSLAATLYHLLTNLAPPDVLTRVSAIIGGRPDALRPASEVNPQVSAAVSEVLKRGMAIDVEQRFASALEMRQALKDASQRTSPSEAQTIASPPPTVLSPMQIPREVQPTIVAPVPVFEPPRYQPSPALPARKSKTFIWVISGAVVLFLMIVLIVSIQSDTTTTPERYNDNTTNTNTVNAITTNAITTNANISISNRASNVNMNSGNRNLANMSNIGNMNSGNIYNRNMSSSNANIRNMNMGYPYSNTNRPSNYNH